MEAAPAAATSLGLEPQWVAGRIMWWVSTLTITSFFFMVVGVMTSPGAWWSEGPHPPPFCHELAFQWRDSRWEVVTILAGPLLISAVLLGMLSRWQQARFLGLRAVVFPKHRRTVTGFAVLIATAIAARAIHDASLRRLGGADYVECVEALWPGPLAWVLGTASIACMFALGTRALDYK